LLELHGRSKKARKRKVGDVGGRSGWGGSGERNLNGESIRWQIL